PPFRSAHSHASGGAYATKLVRTPLGKPESLSAVMECDCELSGEPEFEWNAQSRNPLPSATRPPASWAMLPFTRPEALISVNVGACIGMEGVGNGLLVTSCARTPLPFPTGTPHTPNFES